MPAGPVQVVNDDHMVNTADLLIVINAWGSVPVS
jgi:hypothetical protein